MNPSLRFSKKPSVVVVSGKSRIDRTRTVRDAINSSRINSQEYEHWYGDYSAAFEACYPGGLCVEKTANWRVLIGLSTSPAVETGIVLHPLLGFPILPGSAVRGLCRQQAEVELLEGLDERGIEIPERLPAQPSNCLKDFIDGAKQIRSFFGSIVVETGPFPESGRRLSVGGYLSLWKEHIESLGEAIDRKSSWGKIQESLDLLLDTPTSGSIAFMDAVPLVSELGKPWLSAEVMTPHYSKYYSAGPDSDAIPEDSESPKIIAMPAVTPGLSFMFRIGHRRLADCQEDTLVQVRLRRMEFTLDSALGGLGIGAKTSSGFGYFEEDSATSRVETIRFRIISPTLVGGADNGIDKTIALRPSSIRGMLRFWTRAFSNDNELRQIESNLWGSTEVGQRVVIAGVKVSEGAIYKKSDFLQPGRNSMCALQPGADVEVSFRCPREFGAGAFKQLQASIWAWLNLGAIGRRSRRGFGSMLWIREEGDLLSDFIESGPPRSGCELADYLSSGVKRVAEAFGTTMKNSCTESNRFCVRSLKQIFVGRPLSAAWDNSKGGMADILHGWTHAIGDEKYLGSAIQSRLASPMAWRVFPCQEESREGYRVVMIWSPRRNSLNAKKPIIDENLNTKMGIDLSKPIGP